jgi:hypothetical protein
VSDADKGQPGPRSIVRGGASAREVVVPGCGETSKTLSDQNEYLTQHFFDTSRTLSKQSLKTADASICSFLLIS